MNVSPSSSPLATIVALSRLIVSTLDRDEVFRRILQAAHELSMADSISIMLLNEQRTFLQIHAALGLSSQEMAAFQLAYGEGIAGWVVAHGEAVHVVEPRADTRYLPRPRVRDLSNLLALPLWSGDQTVGVLNLSYYNRYELFAADVVQLLEIFAGHAAIAITNAATAARLQTIARRERLLNLCNEALRTPARANEIVQQVVAELATALDLAACLVLRTGGAATDYLVVWPPERFPGLQWHPAPPAIEEGRTESVGAGEVQLRLMSEDREIGLLRAFSARIERKWTQEEVALLRAVADQIAAIQINTALIAREQHGRELGDAIARLLAPHHAGLSRESLLNQVLDQLAHVVSYDMAALFQYRDDDYAYLVALRGAPRPAEPAIIAVGPGSLSARLFASGECAYLPDVDREPDWQRLRHANRVRAWIGVPLRVNARTIGLLSLSKPAPDSFAAEDVYLAQSIGSQLSMGFYHAQLLHEAQQRAAQLQVLYSFSMQLNAILTTEELLNEAARLLHEHFGYYQVMLGLVVNETIQLLAVRGKINRAEEFGSIPMDSVPGGLTGWAVRERQIVLVNNVKNDPRFLMSELLRETAAELVVPILSAGRAIGVINVESNVLGAFDHTDCHLLAALAAQIAVALENIQRHSELQQVNEQLSQSERLRALGELASGVAHDFNNLLTSILGHTQLLLLDEARSDIRESLGIIERAALDGAATVRRLQDFAQTHRSTPLEPVDINSLVEESLAITRPHWRDAVQSKGIYIAIKRHYGCVPAMLGDGPSLREMVMNLILNAIAALPEGGTLELRTNTIEDEHGAAAVQIEVQDSGVGIPDSIRARIFDPFFTTKGQRGTGMGLAMVYGIVQRHRGTITVESAEHAGTTFSIMLPIVKASLTEPADAFPNRMQETLCILVVDDEEVVRTVIVNWLRRWGHEVIEASSGFDALALLATRSIDLLCTDLGMPEMSGWDLIARVKALDNGLPILLITGWGEQISLEEAQAHGVDDVLVKPFEGERLQQTVRGLLAQRHTKDEG
jgi:signal transduction histidine kinase/CheY-like chemotaxis protein